MASNASVPGSGTTQVSQSALANSTSLMNTQKQILFVDDEPRVLDSLRRVFAEYGHLLQTTCLSDADAAWDRVGVHAERGEESLGRLVTMYAGHDRIHLSQIETIRTGLFPKAGRAARKKSVAKKAKRR